MNCCGKAQRRGGAKQYNYTTPKEVQYFYMLDQLPIPSVPRPLSDATRDSIFSKDLDSKTVVFSSQPLLSLGEATRTLQNSEFRAQNCRNCVFLVLESVRSVTVDDCSGCVFVIFCSGSVFLRECADFQLACVCKQLRLRGSSGRVGGLVKTAPVLERCKDVVIGQFGLRTANEEIIERCAQEARKCGVDPSENKIDAVYDFTPPEQADRKNYDISDGFCGAILDAGAQASRCSILPVWSCFFGDFGVNCTAEVAIHIAEKVGHVVRAWRIPTAKRAELGLEKQEFECYVIVDAAVNEEALCASGMGRSFLVLSTEDVSRLKKLEA